MYPNYDTFAWVVYPEFFIFALLVSGVSGVLASLALKLRIRAARITKDALLAATVALITVCGLGYLRFKYAFVTAVIVAVFLPTLRQFSRLKGPGRSES
jgi:hypothetical protein